MLRVKEAFTAGNAVRFPDSNYFSTLIAGVQDGAKVSGDEAVDAAWSDFHQRTVNVPDASKASFGIIQSVADNPSPFQSKLLHNDLGARSIDRSPLDSSTAFGPVTPTTHLVMQQFNAPLLHGSQRTASIESASSFAILPDTAIGWFCTADGLVIDSNGQPIVGSHSTLSAEGEGDESLVPEVTLPELEAWNHSGSISTYQPSTNTNGQSISTQGSFTASTTSESDMTIPGVHSVHTINRVWIDSQRWSVTESLIFAFNVTVSVPLPEPDEDSSGSDGSNGDDTEGLSSDLSHTHDIEETTSASATITRKGFVILVFHAERGITTPSAAGVKWSFNVNYSDAITIGIEAGAESTVTPKEPAEESEGSGSNGGGSEGDGSEGDGSEGGGGREGDIPDDFQGESSFGISASVTVWARGNISLSATPEIVMIGTESVSAIDTAFTYEDTVRVGVDVLLGGNWQSSSGSGDLNTPTDPTVIEPPEGTQEALEGATPPASSSPSLGSGPVTVPHDGRMGGSSSAGDLRNPDLGIDIPIDQPVGQGHQHGSSGGFNANAGASSSSGLRFAGKMRNNSELQSLAGSLRDGLNNKYGDGDHDNEILVYSTGETVESPGSVSTWTGKIITGHGMRDDKIVDVIGELDQTFQINSEKELELNPSEEVEKVIGGGSDSGLDFEILNITTTSLQTSPTISTYTSATLIEASFQQGDSSGQLKVENDTEDSGELEAKWKGDAYNLQDIQSTLVIRKSPPEGATGHSIYVTRDHDIWSFARSEKGDTTTSVEEEGDASNSGTGNAKSKETISYNSFIRKDEDFTYPSGSRDKIDHLRIGKYNKTYENGATLDAATGAVTPSETSSGDDRVSVTGHWLFDVWSYSPTTGELEYHNWDHIPDLVTGAGTYTEVYDPTVRHYDTTNWDPRNSYEHLLDGSPDPNPPPPNGGEPPIAPPTVYPPNPYTGNSFLGWIAGQNGDGVDQVFNFAYGFGDGASFGLSKVIRQNSGLFADRADYNGNMYFTGDMMSAVMPTPGAIAKQGTVVYKLYNKFDDSGKCASMLTKLVHGRCFVAGTKVTLSEIPYSETRESDVWSEPDWYDRSADSFSPSPRFGEKGSGDEGLELSASSLTTQTSSLLIPIEQVAIGSRVPTKNPRQWEYDFALPEPNESTWKRFSLTARDDEGAIVEAEFIRPDWWIEENRIAAGELMPLAIEELGLSGYATIQTVEDCGPIARGDGSVVTGRFTTSRVNVIVRLTVTGPDGTTEVLEGTTVHPIWSVDRDDWIQLSELQEGERLQAANGIATVVSIAIVSTNVPVYNIEVHGEHVYQVGELELLVHNACSSTSGNSYFAQFGRLAHQRYMSNLANGIDKVKEFVLPSGRRIDFIDTVNGFVYELKPNNPRAIQRGYNQVSSYIAELMSMPEFAHITKWKGIIDVY